MAISKVLGDFRSFWHGAGCSKPSFDLKLRMDRVYFFVGSYRDVLYLGNLKGGLSEVPGERGPLFANFAKPA